MTTFVSKIKTGIKKMFLFMKPHIFIILLAWIILYQNDRINELEKDLWGGFAFESTTDIVDRLADEVEELKSKTENLESNTEDTSSVSSDLESRIDDVESTVSDIESSISNIESSIRRLKWDL